jgi:hypothetical protein
MQQPLFHEDVYEALRTDVMALGGFKRVGAVLWPELAADKAGERLNACMDRGRREKLDVEQLMLIGRMAREIGSYATVFFLAEDCGFSRPTPIDPEDEKSRLQKDFITAVEKLSTLQAQLQRAEARK